MPPKKASNQPNKKVVEKQKQKVIEDKTFGLKNKKGGKQQKFIQQVQKQVTQGNRSAREIEKAKQEKEEKKEQKKRELDEINDLFKPVVAMQKIGRDVDPKSVLCAYFKQGLCTKGKKCRFSHDLDIERKTVKRNIYENEEKDDMSEWDINKLEEVIDKRHGAKNKGLPPTAIVCKFFLDAVESSKYGWFWECPNGKTCHYRHALPQGHVLDRDKKKMQEQEKTVEISLEELIEKQRASLGPNQTKVTWVTFMAWKRKQRSEKIKKAEEEKELKEKEYKQGKQSGLSGRELFDFNPELRKEEQDDGDDDGDVYVRDAGDIEEEMGNIREIKLTDFYENLENGENELQVVEDNEPAIDEDLFNVDDLEGLDDELEKLNVE